MLKNKQVLQMKNTGTKKIVQQVGYLLCMWPIKVWSLIAYMVNQVQRKASIGNEGRRQMPWRVELWTTQRWAREVEQKEEKGMEGEKWLSWRMENLEERVSWRRRPLYTGTGSGRKGVSTGCLHNRRLGEKCCVCGGGDAEGVGGECEKAQQGLRRIPEDWVTGNTQ